MLNSIIGAWIAKREEGKHDAFVHQKLSAIKSPLLFINSDARLYMGRWQLNGFNFFNMTLVSRREVNTNSRIEFIFDDGTRSHSFLSDSDQTEGLFSEPSQLGIAEFDMDATPELIRLLSESYELRLIVKIQNKMTLGGAFSIVFDRYNPTEFAKLL